MFDKAVFLTIFRSVTHSDCLLFVHFLRARRHGSQTVTNLSFTAYVIGCLTRYHQVTVHTVGLPGFHNTPGSRPFLHNKRNSIKQSSRVARIGIKYGDFRLNPPRNNIKHRPKTLPDLKICAIYAYEINPPKGVKPLEWMLLTNLPVKSFADASKKYCAGALMHCQSD